MVINRHKVSLYKFAKTLLGQREYIVSIKVEVLFWQDSLGHIMLDFWKVFNVSIKHTFDVLLQYKIYM